MSTKREENNTRDPKKVLKDEKFQVGQIVALCIQRICSISSVRIKKKKKER